MRPDIRWEDYAEPLTAAVHDRVAAALRPGPMTADEQQIATECVRELYALAGHEPLPSRRVVVAPSLMSALETAGAASETWSRRATMARQAAEAAALRGLSAKKRKAMKAAFIRAELDALATPEGNGPHYRDQAFGASVCDIGYRNAFSLLEGNGSFNTIVRPQHDALRRILVQPFYEMMEDYITPEISQEIEAACDLSGDAPPQNDSIETFFMRVPIALRKEIGTTAGQCALIAFARDHWGFGEHDEAEREALRGFAAWEQLSTLCGYGFLHPKFCVLTDRPCWMRTDKIGRLHSDEGPAILWANGWGAAAKGGKLGRSGFGWDVTA